MKFVDIWIIRKYRIRSISTRSIFTIAIVPLEARIEIPITEEIIITKEIGTSADTECFWGKPKNHLY